ncbi:response regulator [Pseudooceanicola nanhaiensis]|uniref:response regulator n=1 Tax=Pseudooceanicola nanhaiensis TaxID=375761 RepID=UPI001CD46B19|nr:response regulator [Pseudooceanicola nanhaiensis]MCA0922078.1 response regulator [Pseudooceanicola nanhaiensis]
MTGGTAPNFLLVEDDRMDITIFKRAVSKVGLASPVHVANNGRGALDRLRRRTPEERVDRPLLIVLDLNMPLMDGFEFLAELRSDPDLRDHVVFVLTTSLDPGDVQRAYGFNIAGYLTKSSSYEAFVTKVRLLSCYAGSVDLPRGSALPLPAAWDLPGALGPGA